MMPTNTDHSSNDAPARKKPRWRIWIRRGFIAWAVVSTTYLAASFRTRGVAANLLEDSDTVHVVDDSKTLQFLPDTAAPRGLVFICGAGVAAEAYAPLLRPVANAGHEVVIVRLPYRFAPLESHKQSAVARVHDAMRARNASASRSWVLGGHSLGGALACRVARDAPDSIVGLVLLGTTHPKSDDLSGMTMPVTKVYASRDGVAPMQDVETNKRLLPQKTRWVLIDGGNHSQFGCYGHQWLDGSPTVSREAQQARTRQAIRRMLASE